MAFTIQETDQDAEHPVRRRKRTDESLDAGSGRVARAIRAMRSGTYSVSMTFLLTLNLFFIIALVLVAIALAGWLGVLLGIVNLETLTTPTNVAIVIYVICLLIGISVAVTIHTVILKPVRRMTRAMQRLAMGDHGVRVACSGWMRPIELRTFAESFNTAAESLAATEIMNRDFMNNFSHEFKTPITSIAGFADLLLADDEIDPDERCEYLRIMSSEAHRLAGLATDVLALSRIEGRTTLDAIEPVDVTEQLRGVMLELERKWAGKRLELELETPSVSDESEDGDDDERPVILRGNTALLRQAWMNLIDNAMKFSDPGGLVCVRCAGREDGSIEVSVADEGQGMDRATSARIFNQFYQGDTSHKTEGNGLGLALVAKIVELHRGSIEVASAPGEGSTFTVTLPAM